MDQSVFSQRFAVVDTETTGLDARKGDRLIVRANVVKPGRTLTVVHADAFGAALKAWAGPHGISRAFVIVRRGGKVIVINPLSELGLRRFRLPSDARSMILGSDVSDIYVQPRVGGDVHLFTALLKGVIEAGGVDETFVTASCDGSSSAARSAARSSRSEVTRPRRSPAGRAGRGSGPCGSCVRRRRGSPRR